MYNFVENYNTEDATLEFKGYAFDSIHNSKSSFALNIDLSEAFDTVYHNIMLRKLQHIWVRGRVFDWFKTYLTDREQYDAVVSFDISTVIRVEILLTFQIFVCVFCIILKLESMKIV